MYVYTCIRMEYYSAIKKKDEILSFVTTRVVLEGLDIYVVLDIYVCMCIHVYIWNITQLLKKKMKEILPFVTKG